MIPTLIYILYLKSKQFTLDLVYRFVLQDENTDNDIQICVWILIAFPFFPMRNSRFERFG